jgi:DNA replication and repair protein RecF
MLDTLTLSNFRSYKHQHISFGPGMNIITGPNGSGKTTILEALHMLIQGSSFRTDDSATVRHGSEWSRLDMVYSGDTYTLTYTPATREKTLSKNKTSLLKSDLNALLFEPEQLRIIHGPPDLRRRWLDDTIVVSTPGYSKTLAGYYRALRQRNALLARGNFNKDDMFVWDVKLAEYGTIIALRRREQVERMDSLLSARYQDISGTKQEVRLRYQSPFGPDYASEFLRALIERTTIDRQRGFTSRGPHREDLVFLLNGSPAAEVASRGERRSLYLATKLLEYGQLAGISETPPLLLLDDVFAEFDEHHKHFLRNLKLDTQIIITTVEDRVPAPKDQPTHYISSLE